MYSDAYGWKWNGRACGSTYPYRCATRGMSQTITCFWRWTAAHWWSHSWLRLTVFFNLCWLVATEESLNFFSNSYNCDYLRFFDHDEDMIDHRSYTRKLTPSPVPELYFLPAPCRGWTRAGKRTVQDNLHAHAQNEQIKNYQVPTTLLASMCRAMPFSENIFFDVDIVIKNIKT